jgi:hypothetical protein
LTLSGLSYTMYDMARSIPTRVNARLDAESQRKIDYIQRRTKHSVSEIIVASLDVYYRALKGTPEGAEQILRDTGFVGGASGPSDLSESYKERLTESLSKKV